MCCRFGTKFLSHKPTEQVIKAIKNSKALDKDELVDTAKLIKTHTKGYVILGEKHLYDSLLAYYCMVYEYCNNESDYILWKLKYNL
jgi:hypothetical protein